jgi:hypothetical protein
VSGKIVSEVTLAVFRKAPEFTPKVMFEFPSTPLNARKVLFLVVE